METIALLLIIAILIILLNFKENTTRRFSEMENRLRDINKNLADNIVTGQVPAKTDTADQPAAVIATEADTYWKSNFKIAEDEDLAVNAPIITQPAIQAADETGFAETIEEATAATGENPYEPWNELPPEHAATKMHKPGFFERNPDLEKFIGENLVSKIGIGILVLAIGFFVKYAIDNNWIGEIGRVGIGLLCGGILVGLAHRLHKEYKAFSSVMVGGGMAVFYFTITLAYQNFHLFSQTVSFIIMIVITVFAVVLSLLYDRQELAIISMVGGLASPFMVSNGAGNYHALFIYMALLNGGLLVIAYHKAWRLLNLLAFIFTVIIFSGWLLTVPYNDVLAYWYGLVYATIFYLMFFAINIAHNVRQNKRFIASDFGILLANTSLYFGAGLYLLFEMNAGQYKGLFSAAMGVFNLAASYLLLKSRKADTNVLYLLIGITLTFVSLTAPLQLHGNYITLFWASEAVLLYWIYQKSRINLLQVSSLLVWAAMLISLLMDWSNVYSDATIALPVIINKGFITSIYSAVASYLLFLLVKRHHAASGKPAAIPYIFGIAAIVFLFSGGALEINYQYMHYCPLAEVNQLYLLLYSLAFACLLIFINKRFGQLQLNAEVQAGLLSACIIFYFLQIKITYNVQEFMLVKQYYNLHFIAHWLSAVLIVVILYLLIQLLRNNDWDIRKKAGFTWLLCGIITIFFSIEIHLMANALHYDPQHTLAYIRSVYVKASLSILWGLCSFTFMWLGMKYKYRPLRIVSLTLFSITLLKLFLSDISNITAGGKIAAFFCLGILLLVVSFMYQRLKKIISDDEAKTTV